MDEALLDAHLRAIRAAIIAVALALLAISVNLGSLGLGGTLLAATAIGFIMYSVAPSSFASKTDA
ncbi:hypothetical protein [Natronococcus occultus]|uniref:Uncharacterized protein n=1 Tax=Natronococcus occultus SP4 TaxID=694430 RepID=L0K5N6_9EURY|nr:hypothetical protein [Natronococcus occultus]AGB39433.1 hypothetical protein Natoc_3718 [Natronococcus occultus SP4]